ncbi:polyprenyl synthetase family protein [Porphyromonas sp. COT-239 OH1446]|uniref:polyprenyl synthetase family protein n=1 Tax=Porphyromonas sp. COT-239 OH1446 TaxID=1515613 RepID=UPI00052D0456|nr:polyprenyl synthetase family protein [Porphyromonas sp. COT-239 OH1446]KGN67711.1 isoprenyl synthetase [Porphyromonas sp. COT-239 OH1446]
MNQHTPLRAEMLSAIELSLQQRGFAHKTPEQLFAPIDYTLRLGGKRIRPLLSLLAAHLLSESWREALPVATAVEIFHNFTLLHDDLMDRSPLRRGQPTVYCRWDDNTAILSGDAMCIEAYRALEGVARGEILAQVLPRFSAVALEVCQGQQYDMNFERRDDVSVDEYLEMIRLKTSVLIGLALELGAMSVGADEEICHRLYQVGESLGLAFQLQDDLLDVYGDEATFGKPVGTDIANAKKTLLLLYTQAQLPVDQRHELAQLLCLPPERNAERIERVRALYDRVGVRSYAEGLIEDYTRRALERLASVVPDEARRAELEDLFRSLMHRNS